VYVRQTKKKASDAETARPLAEATTKPERTRGAEVASKPSTNFFLYCLPHFKTNILCVIDKKNKVPKS